MALRRSPLEIRPAHRAAPSHPAHALRAHRLDAQSPAPRPSLRHQVFLAKKWDKNLPDCAIALLEGQNVKLADAYNWLANAENPVGKAAEAEARSCAGEPHLRACTSPEAAAPPRDTPKRLSRKRLFLSAPNLPQGHQQSALKAVRDLGILETSLRSLHVSRQLRSSQAHAKFDSFIRRATCACARAREARRSSHM